MANVSARRARRQHRQRRAENRRVKRAERRARERIEKAIPCAATRSMLEFGRRALDEVWARDGFGPPLAAVVLDLGGRRLANIAPVEEILDDLRRLAPPIVRYAAAGERLRVLAAADAWIVAVPKSGAPEAIVCGRPGRFLAEEGLDDLADLAAREMPIATGGQA